MISWSVLIAEVVSVESILLLDACYRRMTDGGEIQGVRLLVDWLMFF